MSGPQYCQRVCFKAGTDQRRHFASDVCVLSKKVFVHERLYQWRTLFGTKAASVKVENAFVFIVLTACVPKLDTEIPRLHCKGLRV